MICWCNPLARNLLEKTDWILSLQLTQHSNRGWKTTKSQRLPTQGMKLLPFLTVSLLPTVYSLRWQGRLGMWVRSSMWKYCGELCVSVCWFITLFSVIVCLSLFCGWKQKATIFVYLLQLSDIFPHLTSGQSVLHGPTTRLIGSTTKFKISSWF